MIYHFWDMNPYDSIDRYDFYIVYDGLGRAIENTPHYSEAWWTARNALHRGLCSWIINRDVDYPNDGSLCTVDIQQDQFGNIYYRVVDNYGSTIADYIHNYHDAQRIAHTSNQCFW